MRPPVARRPGRAPARRARRPDRGRAATGRRGRRPRAPASPWPRSRRPAPRAGGRGRPRVGWAARSAARCRAAPRRRSSGGATSRTSAPSTRRAPGSRSSSRSPTRSGSGVASRSRRTAPSRGRTRAPTVAEPTWTTGSAGTRCAGSPTSATSTRSVARNAPGRQQGVAAGQFLDGDPAEVERHPRGRDRALHRRTEGLHAPDRHLPPAEQQPVAGGDRASGQRSGDDGAGSADREGPVDPQPDRRGRVGGRKSGEQLLQRRDQLRHARSGQRADRDGRHRAHGRRRQTVAHVGQHRRRIGEVGLRHREQRVPDAEGVEDGDVLGGLGRPAVVRSDHDQRGGHRPDAGEHVADEPLVAGDVDDGEPPAGGQRRPGEAEVDGQPAPAFLGPAVGLHPGQGADQRRLAVVDVTGGGDHVHGAGHHRAATARTAAARASSDDGGRLRRFSSVRPSSR